MYNNVQVLPRCYKKNCTSRSRFLNLYFCFAKIYFAPPYTLHYNAFSLQFRPQQLKLSNRWCLKKCRIFFARDLSTAQSGAPFIGFEMNDWLRQELNEQIYPDGLDYKEEDIPDIMTCAGLLVNFICFNIDVSRHTTSN